MTDPVDALAQDIEQELARLEELRREAMSAPEPRDTFTRRAVGSIVHDFYTCCERVFRRIALSLDGHLPEESGWHRRLLAAMANPVEGVRPAVISQTLASALDEYLGFRHVFRNIYGFELEGERLVRLLREIGPVADRVSKEVRGFLTSLRVKDT